MKLSIFLFLAACGSSTNPGGGGVDLAGGGGNVDLAGVDLAGADFSMAGGGGGDLAMGAYPAGPYGNTVGATFPPLVWEGYVATDGSYVVNTMASTSPFGPYSADAARKSGKQYAMVHVSEFF